ncbi:MAG: acyltransferase family protein, partial [Planctomycetia bacterium]
METGNHAKADISALPDRTNIPNARRHDLDALRACAMLLGICLHSMLAYSGMAWIVMDNKQNHIFKLAIDLIHGFRMPLFFLVSGFFTAMLACRQGTGTMLKNRAARILIPFLISVVTIIPLDKVVGLFALLANASHPQDP